MELDKIKLDEVVKDLEQIYAEALHIYNQGETLYIQDFEAMKIAEQIQFERFRADELEEVIVDWLDTIPEEGLKINDNYIIDKNKLHVQEIVIHCLKEQPGKSKLSTRIGNVLKRLGYKSQSFRVDGKVKYGYVKKS